jgi:hypothetical protein
MRGLPTGYSLSSNKLRYETVRNGMRRTGESSMILIGPARSGKGTDLLVPMLLEYDCP